LASSGTVSSRHRTRLPSPREPLRLRAQHPLRVRRAHLPVQRQPQVPPRPSPQATPALERRTTPRRQRPLDHPLRTAVHHRTDPLSRL